MKVKRKVNGAELMRSAQNIMAHILGDIFNRLYTDIETADRPDMLPDGFEDPTLEDAAIRSIHAVAGALVAFLSTRNLSFLADLHWRVNIEYSNPENPDRKIAKLLKVALATGLIRYELEECELEIPDDASDVARTAVLKDYSGTTIVVRVPIMLHLEDARPTDDLVINSGLVGPDGLPLG